MVVFSDERPWAVMMQMGFPENIAKNYAEMGQAIHSGIFMKYYWKHHPINW
jgi:hypothetical protein